MKRSGKTSKLKRAAVPGRALEIPRTAPQDMVAEKPASWAQGILLNWTPTESTVCLFLLTVLFLAPFAGSAFHIDDTLFLWTAKHIVAHPLDLVKQNASAADLGRLPSDQCLRRRTG